MSSLDDIKSTSQSDNNAVKTLALDHLGIIAAHLRTSMLKFKRDPDESGLSPLDEVSNCADGRGNSVDSDNYLLDHEFARQ